MQGRISSPVIFRLSSGTPLRLPLGRGGKISDLDGESTLSPSFLLFANTSGIGSIYHYKAVGTDFSSHELGAEVVTCYKLTSDIDG